MNLDANKLNLFCSIMDFGKGSKVMKLAKKLGAVEGVVFLGKGTVKNELLNILGVLDVRKEIFLTIIDEPLEETLYEEVSKKFHLNKSHHGIAFSMPLKNLVEMNEAKYVSKTKEKGGNNVDYEAIFAIVDKGLYEDVLDAAEAVGSKGGTVIHGRGSGTEEKEKLFNIVIEPEKDIILILSKTNEAEKIVNAIKEVLNVCKPGAGIIFTLDVTKTLGLYED